MTVPTLDIQRREHKRYKVGDGTFIVLRPQPNSSKLGRIIDVSRGGLAFHYSDSQEQPGNFSELDIFISGEGFLVGNMQFEVRSEITLPQHTPLNSVSTKRFGVKFGPMTEKNKSQLYYFIRNFAIADQLPDNSA